MKAIRVKAFTDPMEYILEDIPTPTPGQGECLVRVHTAAISFGDMLISSGRYQVRPHLPFTPGAELSGTIETVGDGVTEIQARRSRCRRRLRGQVPNLKRPRRSGMWRGKIAGRVVISIGS